MTYAGSWSVCSWCCPPPASSATGSDAASRGARTKREKSHAAAWQTRCWPGRPADRLHVLHGAGALRRAQEAHRRGGQRHRHDLPAHAACSTMRAAEELRVAAAPVRRRAPGVRRGRRGPGAIDAILRESSALEEQIWSRVSAAARAGRPLADDGSARAVDQRDVRRRRRRTRPRSTARCRRRCSWC